MLESVLEEMETVSEERSFKEKSRNFLKGQNLNQQIKMTLKGCQVVTDVNLKKKKNRKKSWQKEKWFWAGGKSKFRLIQTSRPSFK